MYRFSSIVSVTCKKARKWGFIGFNFTQAVFFTGFIGLAWLQLVRYYRSMKLVMLIVVVSLLGCGRSVDSDLAPYLNKFIEASWAYDPILNANVSVEFADDLEPGTLAECQIMPWGKTVLINHQKWDRALDASREVAVFHELGHCVLGRDHLSKNHVVDGTSTPMSIMRAMPVDPERYQQFRENYIRELFTGSWD